MAKKAKSAATAKPAQLFIPDGETRTAFIAASDGDYPAIRFTYRRATARMLPNLVVVNSERDEKQITAMAELLATRIIGLCTVDDNHQNVPIAGEVTADRLLTISPFLFRKIQFIITGLAKSDPDPLDATVNETADTDLKNSEQGSGSFASTPRLQPGHAPSAQNSDSTKATAV